MRRIAAAKRAAAEAAAADSAGKKQKATGGQRADRLSRAVDLARRKNLVEHRETVLTDATGAVAPEQLKTLVDLMGQQNTTAAESRAILLTLGRTAQKAPERLRDFAEMGGLTALGTWLQSSAPNAQAPEQRAVAVGCVRIMAKMPVSQPTLQQSKVAPVVKDIAHRCPWMQQDVQALLKHWYSVIMKEQITPGPTSPGLSPSSSSLQPPPMPLSPTLAPLAPPLEPAGQPSGSKSSREVPSSSSSSGVGGPASSSEVAPQSSVGLAAQQAAAAPQGAAASQSAAPGGKAPSEPCRSRFEPRKPEEAPEAKKRRVEDSRMEEVESQAAAEKDAEVQALLKELESLNDLLVPD